MQCHTVQYRVQWDRRYNYICLFYLRDYPIFFIILFTFVDMAFVSKSTNTSFDYGNKQRDLDEALLTVDSLRVELHVLKVCDNC